MRRTHLVRRIALVACAALSVAMLPLMSVPAPAATWTRIASGGVDNANNLFLAPGHPFGDGMAVCSLADGLIFWPPGPVSSYTYDGTQFAKINTAGFDDSANIRGLFPSAVYDGELYIGTYNISADPARGGELYRWTGNGSPIKVPESNDGWGEGNLNVSVVPMGVVNNKLVVSVQNVSYAPGGGLRIYEFDGSSWKRVVGAGAAYPAGFGDFNNEYTVPAIDWKLFGGSLVFTVANFTTGTEVWSYDGTAFTRLGKAGDPGLWAGKMLLGATTVSTIEDRLYLGTLDGSLAPTGGEIWSYDGTAWTQVIGQGAAGTPTGPGFGDPNSIGLEALVRGSDLYVATWNFAVGSTIYKRQGAAFTPISQPNFGQPGNANATVALGSYGSSLMAFTGNHTAGSEVWSTAIGPSIDYLEPGSGPYGATVALVGHDFLPAQGSGRVLFNGAEARDVLSWSDTRIEVLVPPDASSGPVKVTQANGDSNEVSFEVTLSSTYYFAEGTTRKNSNDGTYEEWICLQNPQDADANVDLTYMLADGTVKNDTVKVVKKSRKTISVNTFLGDNVDVSTLVESDQLILAERPMYFNYRNKWTGGHNVMGLPAPRTTFYFAEGTTRDNVHDGSFEEWLCIQNPGSGDANVKITYMLETGDNVVRNYTVRRTSRKTVDVNLDVGKDHDVSMLVESDRPIVAERPMYFNYRNKWTGGHNVVGAPAPDTTFYFAEGTTRRNDTDGHFEEWVCIQNPGKKAADVTITYYTAGAGTQTQEVTIDPASRETIDVWLKLGSDVDASFKVTSSVPVLVERPMYFNYHNAWAGGHDVMGCAAPRNSFYFAEGTTLLDFNTWVAVMNTSSSKATVTFNYMLGDGTNKQATVTVEPNQRYTREVVADVGINQDVSILVESDRLIVAERPMYFGYHGWCPGGHTTLGYGL